MKTREVWRILSCKLEPTLVSLGFSRLKDQAGCLVWTRPLGNKRHETLWCQMDKWQWDPWIGSQFVVELQHSRQKEAGAMRGKRARLGDLLTRDERRTVQLRQNRVIKKFRVPSQKEYNRAMGFPASLDAGIFLDEHREACRPVRYKGGEHVDIWLRV